MQTHRLKAKVFRYKKYQEDYAIDIDGKNAYYFGAKNLGEKVCVIFSGETRFYRILFHDETRHIIRYDAEGLTE